LQVFNELYPGFHPALVAGHSMGELSALVAGGALGFNDGLKLVRMRGHLMKRSGEISPGGMAAILGLDIPTLDKICAEASLQRDDDQREVVQVANDNCPGQVVISGSRPALERALSQARGAGARKAIPLPISIAAHSPLMAHSQEDFNRAVDEATITDPSIPLVGNVTATSLTSAGQLRLDLQAQLTHRVRWTESIQLMIQQGITTFLELGSGSVLTGLLKRIDSQVQGISIGTPADFEKLNAV
jgi:[acyl-carrier-protein] S-malonyltransferase